MRIQFARVFENDFENMQSFVENVILPVFGEDYEAAPIPESILDDHDKIEAARKANIVNIQRIGAVELLNPIQVFDITVQDSANIARSRVGIQLFIRRVLFPYSHAFMIFHYENSVDREWRFSYLFKEGTASHATTAKRYTYLFGRNHHCRTAVDRFALLARSKKDDKALLDAFSVEALTKQFYGELFDWYQWAIDGRTGITFPGNKSDKAEDREQNDTRIIRLITRLMFVWFVKQKEMIPDKLFETDNLKNILKDFEPQSAVSGNYYNAILQNLFFATLNRAIIDGEGSRTFAKKKEKDVKTLYRYSELFDISENEVIELFADVPFLNGGLFECLDKIKKIDGVEKAYSYDGFSRNDKTSADGRYKNRAFIPNVLFFEPEKGLFPILKRYNFTVEENTPQEQQVALGPELLGKIFENLLGAYNPETKETARNQSGSFYTPREIVEYMVDESLIAYLGDTPLVRSLFSNDFQPDELHWSEYQSIAGHLKSVKILDPACGSGAFPMGLLNRIIDVLKKINADESTYQLKLNLIENCIYGVDKQSIATQISKLRFFISLVCDCEKEPSKPNFGIPTLPNLETKFVCADSLTSKKEKDTQGNLFVDPNIEEIKGNLMQIRHQHFKAKTASEKKSLRDNDKKLREQLADLLSNNLYPPEDAQQLADWNPYDQNAVSPFFDSKWMFGVDSFDIVIGNPPYIQLQNNEGGLAKLYEQCGFKTFARTGDIYCLFYERGWQLLKPKGHLCYITSNKWMRTGYGEKTRDFFIKETNPQLLIDFADVKIFDSATVETNILLLSKNSNTHKTICAVTNKKNKDSVNNLGDFVQQYGNSCSFDSSDSWVILSPIEQSIKRKIEAVGTPLKDWDIQINYGIKTGFNDAFIIDTDKREEILAKCQTEEEYQRTAELIRPILRGRDIKRYGYDWAGLWLISTFPSRHYDIKLFPAVKNYLLSFGIERLEQTGKTYIVDGKKVKARKKTNNKWFETQDSISYWEDFSKPKILWKRVGSILRFCYNENLALGLDSTCFATGKNIEFICCVLNSPMGHYLLKDAPKTGTGDLLISVQAIIPIMVPIIGNDINSEFSRALKLLIYDNNTDIEKEISHKVFGLYGLSNKEQLYIIENFS